MTATERLPPDAPIFVAGHRGMLGSAMASLLQQKGFRRLLLRSRAELDLTDVRSVKAFFQETRPRAVFLCAGLTGGIQANMDRPAEFLHTNLAIQDAVFEASRESEARIVVFYGSSCVYPVQSIQPIPEEALGTGSVEPTSAAYAAAKTAGITACQAYNRQYAGTRFIALIPNTMYGPGDRFDPGSGHVLPALIHRFHLAKTQGQPCVRLWGTGAPRREFIHVEDVARASLFAAEAVDRLENHHYNLGTGEDIRILDLAALVARVVGFAGELLWDPERPDGAARKLLDSSRFRSLGWAPETRLEAGLMRTYQWYLENVCG